jgi:hypothetical protein
MTALTGDEVLCNLEAAPEDNSSPVPLTGQEVLCNLEAALQTEDNSSPVELLQRLPEEDLLAVGLHLMTDDEARERLFAAALYRHNASVLTTHAPESDLETISDDPDWEWFDSEDETPYPGHVA